MTQQRDPFDWLPGYNQNSEDARDALAQNEEMLKQAAMAAREEARLFFDVFSVGRGPELLEYMRSRTIEVDLMNLSRVIGTEAREVPVNPAEWAFHRNGQNSVVRWIETMIRTAMQAEAEETENV